VKTGSLCTGYAGLDMAVHEVLGGELAWVADNDPDKSAILAYRFPDAPNLGDLEAVDWSAVEPVDVLTAGFPCKDISCAGQQAGLRKGNRSGVWYHVARAIAELRPPLVIIDRPGAFGRYEAAVRHHERVFGRLVPPPVEPGRTGNPRLSPRFSEWMMFLPDGWVTDVPGLSRNAQLTAIGDGVVPAQAAMALRLLLDRAGILPLIADRGAA
jgi:C-5 cytosine-specific DNA methylase